MIVVKVFDINGKEKEEAKLPKVFSTPYRPDIIKRAFLAIQSWHRQPYGPDELAGKRTSAHYIGHQKRYGMKNREIARGPRIHGSNPAQEWRVRFAPHAVSGRRAHPPLTEKVWYQKINNKELRLAIASAVAATASIDLLKNRNYILPENIMLPIVVEDEIENLKKVKDIMSLIKSLGLEKNVEKASEKKVRPGRGKMRGRRYKKKRSILFVFSKDSSKYLKNIPGADFCTVDKLDITKLAPGAVPGRLTIWSKSAIEKLDKILGEKI